MNESERAAWPLRSLLIRLRPAAVGAVAVIAAIGALNMLGVIGDHHQPTAAARQGSGAGPSVGEHDVPGVPCDGARIANSSDDIKTSMRFFTTRDIELSRAWTCPDDAPILMYGHVQATFNAGANRDPSTVEATFNELAKSLGGSVETIQGRLAYVERGNLDEDVYDLLIMDVDDVRITLLGDREAKLEDLITVAKDLDLPIAKP